MRLNMNITMSLIVFTLLGMSMAFADNHTSAEAETETSVKVGGLLWKVQVLLDRVDVALTLDKEKKAEKALEKAKERLSEVQKASLEADIEAAAKAQAEHARLLAQVESRMQTLEQSDDPREEKEKQKLEILLRNHQDDSENVAQRLNVRVRGDLSVEQKAELDALVADVRTSTNYRIDIQTDDTKAVIRQRTVEGNTSVNFTKVEIEIKDDFSVAHINSFQNGTKINAVFKLNTTDEDTIFARLEELTGLDESHLEANARIKIDTEDSDDTNETSSSARAKTRVKIGNGGIESESEVEVE